MTPALVVVVRSIRSAMENKTRKLNKKCACCGKNAKVILYKDGTYRGGHYFGKIPLYKKSELNRIRKFGTRKARIGDMIVDVLKKSPKPYGHEEYWECPKCYWRK